MAQVNPDADSKSGKVVANTWEKAANGALQLVAPYGVQQPAAAAAADDDSSSSSAAYERLQALLLRQLLPALMWQAGRTLGGVLPAAAAWDVSAAVARAGWQGLGALERRQQRQEQQAAAAAADGGGGDAAAAAAAVAAVAAVLIPASDSREQIQEKMLCKHVRLFEQQQLLLDRTLQVLTQPFTGAGSIPTAAAAGSEDCYRPQVPAAAWCGLQLACYISHRALQLWEGDSAAAVAVERLAGASHDASSSSPAAHAAALRQQLEVWEFELLQRHVWHSLKAGLGYCLPPAAAAAAAAAQLAFVQQHAQSHQLVLPVVSTGSAGGSSLLLTELLMSDWVTRNLQHPALHGPLLEAAAAVYAKHGLEPPIGQDGEAGQLPPHEPNPLDAALPAVAIAGTAVQSAAWAQVGTEAGESSLAAAGQLAWPRCSASLELCAAQGAGAAGGGSWGCSSCGRRYTALPSRVPVSSGAQQQQAGAGMLPAAPLPAAPVCLVCGLRLSPGGAAAAGLPGCSRQARVVLDGSPAVGIGLSLSDSTIE
jgi:hypothetical protein